MQHTGTGYWYAYGTPPLRTAR
ncbi:hypothetical protein A2U01_0105670, partial [Trifolium medium]|nr:hypothetical protein [Trifolium medium]